MRKSGPSQRDIALAAGVSQAAVSFVLNGRAAESGIPPATEARIRETLDKLGYVANAAARSLRGGRNGLIGVHTFEPVFPVGSADYYNDFLVGIEEQAVEMRQDLILFASTQDSEGSRTIYGSGSNRLQLADGAVMLGLETNDHELVRLAGEGYPFVFVGRRDIAGARFPFVAADYATATGESVRLVAHHGHTAIAYVAVAERSGPRDERLRAFKETVADLQLDRAVILHVTAEEITEEWLSGLMERGITALLLEDSAIINGLDKVIASTGLSVPDELSLVRLDQCGSTASAQGWSHIGLPRREQGRRAVALLLALLNDEISVDYAEVIPCVPASDATISFITE